MRLDFVLIPLLGLRVWEIRVPGHLGAMSKRLHYGRLLCAEGGRAGGDRYSTSICNLIQLAPDIPKVLGTGSKIIRPPNRNPISSWEKRVIDTGLTAVNMKD